MNRMIKSMLTFLTAYMQKGESSSRKKQQQQQQPKRKKRQLDTKTHDAILSFSLLHKITRIIQCIPFSHNHHRLCPDFVMPMILRARAHARVVVRGCNYILSFFQLPTLVMILLVRCAPALEPATTLHRLVLTLTTSRSDQIYNSSCTTSFVSAGSGTTASEALAASSLMRLLALSMASAILLPALSMAPCSSSP
jgi:hypothetical protein